MLSRLGRTSRLSMTSVGRAAAAARSRLASSATKTITPAAQSNGHATAKAGGPAILAAAAATSFAAGAAAWTSASAAASVSPIVDRPSIASASVAQCHCQVPCGIFDDPARISTLNEHAATVRKAIVEIHKIAASSAPSGEQFDAQGLNQSARWVSVKEQACSDIITIVSEYMLCQRVKRTNFRTVDDYRKALELHHVLMQSAMKAKQTVDSKACDDLERAIRNVAVMYTK